MKNKKGFTLIELLAVILIVAILLLIAIPGVTKFLNKGTTEYYKSMENNIIIAGREYLNDYRSLLPKKIGNVTVIELNELVSNNYIDEVVDDNEKTCEARMTVKKVNKKDYEYYTCLICDGYQTEGENCSYTEEDNVTPETIYYSIEVKEPGHFVVYQGDDFTVPTAKAYYKKDQLDKQLVDGNVVGYPKIIDTNKLGKTTVTYSYQGAKNSITVEVKDNVKPSVPQVVLKYDNVNGKKYGGNWYNGNIYVEFKSTDYSKNNIVGSGIAYYEISEDEKTWNKISSNNTTITESSKTAEGTTYYVRAVDKAGNTGTTNTYMVKIDKKVPGCVLASNDSIGSENWHKAKFQLDLKTQDNKTNISGNNYYLDTNSNPTTSRNNLSISNETAETINYGKICSGAGTCSYCDYTVRLDMTKPTVEYDLAGGDTTTPKYYNTTKTVTIDGSDSNFKNMIVNSYKNNIKQTGKSTTTTSMKYSVTLDSDGDWIVYTDVYDKAGNKQDKDPKDKNGTYFQRYIIDKDPPTCDFEISGTKGNDPWYRSSVKVSLKTNEASPKGTWISHTTITAEGITVVEGSVTDNAGNVGTCSKEIKIDLGITEASCWNDGDSTSWTSSDRTIKFGCRNANPSGCATSDGKVVFTTTTKTATIAAYTIRDNAGNSVTCPARTANVYVDKTPPSVPTITYNSGSNSCSWKNNYNLTLTSSDTTGISTYQIDHNQDGTPDRNVESNFIPENGYSTCTDRYRAVDGVGNVSGWTAVQHIHMDTQRPTHTEWWWGEISPSVARLYIRTTDNVGISSVQCPTSTASGSYSNWHWFQGAWDSSANAYRCDITPATFGHYNQTYKTHLYIYDHAGNGGYYNETSASIASNCPYTEGQVVKTFDYTGDIQSYTIPCTGTYKLEVWGAQGGKTQDMLGSVYVDGGYGGYSYGNKTLNQGAVLYLGVGGQGGTATQVWDWPAPSAQSVYGGYNGGGKGTIYFENNYYVSLGGGGGGATHIALTNNRGVLANYAANKSEILIVAGGGSGSARSYYQSSHGNEELLPGAVGGGTTGGAGSASGGNQSSGYAFGQGQDSYQTYKSYAFLGSGAGGGYYGGIAPQITGLYVGGGGSGYIGGVTSGSMLSGQRSGNGYARITLVSY